MILNQWTSTLCSGFSILGCLDLPQEQIDDIQSKMLQDKMMSIAQAEDWFKKAWLIDRLKPVKDFQIPIFLKRWQSLITGASNVDWIKTGKKPYTLTWSDKESNSHYFIKDALYSGDTARLQNSWGDKWGDKWYFYWPIQDSRYKKHWAVIPYRDKTDENLIKEMIALWRIDVDNAYGYQCVDFVRGYTNRKKQYITSYGNAIDLWYKWLGNRWKRINKTTFNAPSPWDVIIWKQGQYGHIAISRKSDMVVMRYTDQNGGIGGGTWLGKDAIQNRWGTYKNVLGWFHYE